MRIELLFHSTYCQKQRKTNLRDLLKSKKAKFRKFSELSKGGQSRLAKLYGMLHKLRRGENGKNRWLVTLLTEDESAQIDIKWKD